MQSMEIHYTMQRLICCTIFIPELAMGILRELSRHHAGHEINFFGKEPSGS